MVAAAITLEEEDEIMVIAQTSLWYYGGKSDKVYVVTAREEKGNIVVEAHWGRRGKTMQSQVKGIFCHRCGAMTCFDEVIRSKRIKGYQVTGSAVAG